MLKLVRHQNETSGYNFQRALARSSAWASYGNLLRDLVAEGHLSIVEVIMTVPYYEITDKGIACLMEHYSYDVLEPYLVIEDPSGWYLKWLRKMDGLPDLDFPL